MNGYTSPRMDYGKTAPVDRDRALSARSLRSAYRLKRVASDIDLQKCRCQCTCGLGMYSPVSSSMTELINNRDAEGSSQIPCRLHRRSALRRVQTLNEPNSPKTGRRSQRSASTPITPDTKMLQRNMDPGGGGKDLTKFLLTFEFEENKETIRLPAGKDYDLKEVLEEALGKKGLQLADIDIFITTTSNPLPKNDKSLKVSTEPLGGSEVYIRPAKDKPDKANAADACSLDELPGTTSKSKRKDLSAFLGVKDEVSSKAQMDPKLTKLHKELDGYLVQGLPDFPPLLSLHYQRDKEVDDKMLYVEDSWKSLIDIDIQNTMSKRERELQESIWEIIKKEVTCIKTIRVIIDLYMCCLLNLQTESILNEIETEKIFSNITALETAHTSFWKNSLKKILVKLRDSGKPMDPLDLPQAFQGFSDQFSAYFRFCAEEECCLEYLRIKKDENDVLRAFSEWCHNHPISRLPTRLGQLSELLVFPMQRLTRYHILMERTWKILEDGTAKDAVKKTLDSIQQFVGHINHEIKKEQERKKMERVEATLEGYECYSAPTGCDELTKLIENHSTFDVRSPMPFASEVHPRWLLLEGTLKVQEKSSRTTVYAFLFTDVLVLTKPSSKTGKDYQGQDKYRIVRPPMKIDQMEVVELKDRSGFAVLCVDDYGCAMSGFVAQPEGVTLNNWMDKIGQAKEWYNIACTNDEDYFDDIAPDDDPQTPIVALPGLCVDSVNGFNFNPPSSGTSPNASPKTDRSDRSLRRRSNSPSSYCSSHGSSNSLQRMDEEPEPTTPTAPAVLPKPVANGSAVHLHQSENNSNNRPRTPPKTTPKPQIRPRMLSKGKAYQETDFPVVESSSTDGSSLLRDVVSDIPSTNAQRPALMSIVRQNSQENAAKQPLPSPTPVPLLSPKTPSQQIMSFDDEFSDEESVPPVSSETDIYRSKNSPKHKTGKILVATSGKTHRGSVPNIDLKKSAGDLPNGKAENNGEGTLKKKTKFFGKKTKNIR